MTEPTPAHPADELLRVAEAVHAGEVSVAFTNGPTVRAKKGDKLLDIAEASQVPIEHGCRMGMCGSDPVRIIEGEENLSAMRSAERRTLERLGLGAGCRMACVSRVEGPVVVDPHPAPEEPSEEPTRAVAVVPELKTEIGRVVVIGAGVAGVTAAEELRRVLPDAELTLIGDEPYAFYNRMGITRLVSESVSIESLYLNRRDWAGSRRIDYRRGLPVTAIDRESGDVVLADRERIPYDRVVIATGAAPLVPPIDGFGAAGSFVLRTIDDAVQIQQHVRRHRCRTVVIVGAGLLGLEAAYYLTQLDLRVVMLDRSPWPLSRQLDEQAGALLWEMLHDLGIELLPLIEAERIVADELVTGVELVDGGTIDAELCLAATGVVPNSELAKAAALEVAGGVTVNDAMQTSDPHIYAVGDVVDHQGRRYGLWPASVEQAQVAATSIVGGEAAFSLLAQPARLKVPGIDLLSIGAVEASGEDSRTVLVSAYGTRRYRKLVLDDGRLAGAIILGDPELFDDVTAGVEQGIDLSSDLDAFEHGKWQALSRLVGGATLAG
ncbi:MAG: 2Fe-2S iron-sulfur cluster binding domain-containing protein [Actinobacteria bacterium]|nr:MAG: 2Fe-2S iron-sulfur cluster binding domain-containing protein [Actinomycetota bacterium]